MHMHRRQKIASLVVATVMAIMPSSAVFAATTIGNNVSIGGTLGVTGATTLSGVATISGLATLTSGFISNASSSVAADFQVAGALNASGTLQAAGATVLAGTASIAGLSTLSGGFISSASSSVLRLQVAGTLNASSTAFFGGNLIPSSNNSRNIGAYGTAFQNIYTSSSLFAASSTIFNANSTSTVFIDSSATNRGGQIVLKAYNGTCYAIYIGDFNAGLTGVTSTALASCF